MYHLGCFMTWQLLVMMQIKGITNSPKSQFIAHYCVKYNIVNSEWVTQDTALVTTQWNRSNPTKDLSNRLTDSTEVLATP